MNPKNLVISPVKIEERKKIDIRSGDTVKVFQKIKEKDKFRTQVFEGLVLAVKHGKEAGGTFTVRKVTSGVGVERIFPIYSPMIDKIEIVRRSKVRRAKLYHIRDKASKEIRRQMRNIRNLPEVSISDESQLNEIEQVEEEVTESAEQKAEAIKSAEVSETKEETK